MKITTSSAKGSVQKSHFPAGHTRYDLGIKISQEKAYISFETEGPYRFCLSNLSIKPGTTVTISTADRKQYTVFRGRDLSGLPADKEIHTKVMKGKEFFISIVSSSRTPENQFTLKCVISEPDLMIVNDVNNGTLTSEELKETDKQAYNYSRPIARYDIATGKGTSWILGKGKYIVSNAHVFGYWGTDAKSLVGDSVFLFDSDITKSISIASDKLLKIGTYDLENASNDDYAIGTMNSFDLKYSKIVDLVGGLSLNDIDEDSAINDTVFMVGHPNGTQKVISYYSDGDNTRRGSITGTFEQQVQTDCYATYGSSGSPIISASALKVSGMLWGSSDSDTDGINRGVKGSHIWNAIKSFTDEEDNQSVEGISAQYNIVPGMFTLVNDEEWHLLTSYSDNIIFNEFSGTLTHLDNYSLFSCKSLNLLTPEYIVDLTFRLAQKTDSGLTNLATTDDGNKDLLISYHADDNSAIIFDESYHYKIWVGLKAMLSGVNEISGYYIFQIDLTSN